MGKTIATMFLLFAIHVSTMATGMVIDSKEPKKIDMDINNAISDEVERSLNHPIIEAVFNSDLKQVEMTLCNIGEAEVYIVNSQNQVVAYTTVDADSLITIKLSINGTRGAYYVVVMSAKCYAEGQFIL